MLLLLINITDISLHLSGIIRPQQVEYYHAKLLFYIIANQHDTIILYCITTTICDYNVYKLVIKRLLKCESIKCIKIISIFLLYFTVSIDIINQCWGWTMMTLFFCPLLFQPFPVFYVQIVMLFCAMLEINYVHCIIEIYQFNMIMFASLTTLLYTLVGDVSSDVSRSSCTISFWPCCSIFCHLCFLLRMPLSTSCLMLSMYCILGHPLLLFPGINHRRGRVVKGVGHLDHV